MCLVHGEAQPEVMWYHDTMVIDQTDRHIIEARGTRHSLIIRRVSELDFGNYTCSADNQLGRMRKTITLSGLPNKPIIRSAPISQWKNQYNASWQVESFSRIDEYRMLLRMYFTEHDKMLTGSGRVKIGNVSIFFIFLYVVYEFVFTLTSNF